MDAVNNQQATKIQSCSKQVVEAAVTRRRGHATAAPISSLVSFAPKNDVPRSACHDVHKLANTGRNCLDYTMKRRTL